MVSTPNRPDGLFAQIEKESYESSIYKKTFLHYSGGVGKIHSCRDRESRDRLHSRGVYELHYQRLIGNVFSPRSIRSQQKYGYCPGIWSFHFAIVVTQFVDQRIQVIFAEVSDRDHSDLNIMIDRIWQINRQGGHLSNILLMRLIL